MRSPVNHALTLAAFLLATSITSAATGQAPATGPAADYPVVVGEPYTIGSTTWTPADQLNYDAVGQAGGQEGLSAISAAHKTLPLPSYAEVTALDSGRTILVRVVERGPMVNETLIALSPDAAAQLGFAPGARSPVRVRRVNPPEVERAALRSGGAVPRRMDTPESLLKVLRRKLAQQSPLAPPPSTPPRMPEAIAATDPDVALVSKPPVNPTQTAANPPKASPAPKPFAAGSTPQQAKPAAAPAARTEPAPPSARMARGSTVVQVAAFSSADSARKVAAKLGGQVSQAGRFWRVRLGPFKGSGEAAPALEKARAAGYSDARIQRAD